MSGFTVDQPSQIVAEASGIAMVGGNAKVKGQPGFLGTALDTLSFGNGAVGNWIVPNARTRISGAFMVSQSSQGIATVPTPSPHPAPILVTAGDPRIKSF